MNKQRILAVAVLGTALSASAALAGITSMFNDLVDPSSAFSDFLGVWAYKDSTPTDVDHVVVTEAGSDRVRMQVFGRCENVVCNWGTQIVRVRTEGPESRAVRSITADYNLGYALRHVTLRRMPGHALSYDIVTEFTDGSDRHDYESVGRLMLPGAAAVTAMPAAPVAVPPNLTTTQAPPPSPADVQSYAESPAAAAGGQEDCVQFDGKKAYVASDSSGNWQVRDFLHPVLKFGPNRIAALSGMRIVANYHFDEVCYVGRGSGQMTYWRSAGEIARTPMAQQDCIAVDPAKVHVTQRDDAWKVVEGEHELFDYGDDRASADQAAQVIRTFRLNRQCFFARPDSPMSYWLTL